MLYTKKITIIGQFPPPIHGLSKAIETLTNSRLKTKYAFQNVDITRNKLIIKNIVNLIKSKSDLFYFTISQSMFGNIRDLLIIAILLAKKKKVVIHLHGGYYRKLYNEKFGYILKTLNKKLLSKISRGIVLGDSLKYIFDGIIPTEKIRVVHNCVDNEFLLSDEEFGSKVKLNKENKKFYILYLSNFIESKGYKDVLEVARIMSKTDSSSRIKFLFAGKFYDNEQKVEFERYLQSNNLSNLAEYKGVVEGIEKRLLLYQCDIFLLPTQYPKEGQPISIIEAMANGMSVITTNHAGIPDLITEGKNGFFIHKEQHQEIIEKIIYICNNPKRHDDICINNRIRVKTEFLEESYIDRLETIFDEVLGDDGFK